MEWEDLTHFEGNANAFRILTHQFEGRHKGGFVLTYTTLASIVNIPFHRAFQEPNQSLDSLSAKKKVSKNSN